MHHALQPSSSRPHRALLLIALSLTAAAPGCAATQSKVAEVTGKIGTRHHTGAIAFSPDGKTLALAGRGDGSVVELWNLETGKARVLRSSFNKENTPCTSVIAFSRDGRCLAVEHQKTGVTVWDLDSEKEQAHVPMLAPKSWVNGMAFGSIETGWVEWLSPAQRKSYAAAIPVGRFGRPEEAAELALFLAGNAWVTGQTYVLDGGEARV